MLNLGRNLDVAYTTSGSAAIELALRAAGVSPGDRVLFPTYHCPTMIAPAVRLGALPTFYPLTQTGAPSLSYLRGSDLDGARAILVAHYFGFPQPLEELRRWCSEKGIALIEDFAHAFFSLSSTTGFDALKRFAIASLPKFYPVEEGGCVIADREQMSSIRLGPRSLVDELRAALDGVGTGARYGRMGALSAPLRRLFALKSFLKGHGQRVAPQREPVAADVLSSIAADPRLVKLRATRVTRWIVDHVDQERIIRLRRRNYALLTELFRAVPDVSPLWPELPDHVVPYVFPLRLKSPERRYKAMRARAVPVYRWDVVWPSAPEIPGDTGREWASEMLQVACHQDMSECDVRLVASIIGEIVAEVTA